MRQRREPHRGLQRERGHSVCVQRDTQANKARSDTQGSEWTKTQARAAHLVGAEVLVRQLERIHLVHKLVRQLRAVSVARC